MDQPSTSTLRGVHADQPSVGSMRLYGRWLLFARMIWIAIFVSTLLYFCANLLLDSYGVVTTILLVAATSVWFAVSFVLFLRKSNDRVILLFSLALVLVGGIIVPPYPAPLYVGITWVWEISLDMLEFLAQAVILIFYLFPDGRFVPRWTRWLALVWIVVSLVPLGLIISGLSTGSILMLGRPGGRYCRSTQRVYFWLGVALYAVVVGWCWYQAAKDLGL